MSCNCINKIYSEVNEMPDNDGIFFGGLCEPGNFVLTNANYWSEITVSGFITVPIEKPFIEDVNIVNTKVDIVNKKVVIAPAVYNPKYPSSDVVSSSVKNLEGKITTGRKLIVEGLVCYSVSYASQNKDQSVHTYHGTAPFSAYIIVPYKIGSTDSLKVNFEVSSCIEDVTVKKVEDNGVVICATLLLQAVPSETICDTSIFEKSGVYCGEESQCNKNACGCYENQPIIKGITDVGFTKSLLNHSPAEADDVLWTEIDVPEILNIPLCKPDVAKILSLVSKVDIICQKVIVTPEAVANYENLMLTNRKLIIEAIIRQKITYVTGPTGDCHEEDLCAPQTVHTAHYDVPISAYIVLPKDTEVTDRYRIDSAVEDIFICALNGRQVFKNTVIFLKANNIGCRS